MTVSTITKTFYANGSDASRDHDNDGLNDSIDTDDDNDNILDVDEVGGAWSSYRYDHDNDGIWDASDLDDDNDGLSDWFEANDGTMLPVSSTMITMVWTTTSMMTMITMVSSTS